MNGEFLELLNAIKEWSNEVHGQRHQENLKKFEQLFERLNKLPCDKREGFYTYVKWHLGILTAALFLMGRYVILYILK